jgi:hypothetical protein
MIDALFKRFNVTVKHGASAAAAHPMPGPMNIEPFLGGFFAAANAVPHVRIKDFGATAVMDPNPQSRRSSSVSGIDILKIRRADGAPQSP